MDVAILGASPKEERYAYKAQKMLAEYGHRVVPVRPAGGEILGTKVTRDLGELEMGIDTLTLYVGPQNIGPEIEKIVELAPKRVIMNPGTESPELKDALDAAGIRYIEACTLVLLRTNQFESA